MAKLVLWERQKTGRPGECGGSEAAGLARRPPPADDSAGQPPRTNGLPRSAVR